MAERQPTEEKEVWQGRSSQLTNLGAFTLATLIAAGIIAAAGWFTAPLALAALVLPAAFAIYRLLRVRARHYVLTTERLKITDGILSKRTDSLELYRVKDMTMIQPLALRLAGLGNVALMTSDHTNPTVVMHAVHDPARVSDLVRTHVEKQRDRKRVTEVDMT